MELRKSMGNTLRPAEHTLGLAVANARPGTKDDFHRFLEESPDAVMVVDTSSRIRFANYRIESVFGYGPGELIGKPLGTVIPERYRDLHMGHLDRFMIDPVPRMMGIGLELRALRKDGSEFAVEISLSPHQTPEGLVVVAAIRDVEATRRFQDLMLKELHHRVKNMLATVIAITSQSLGSARDLEEGRLAVESRLVALGRTHDLLLQSNWAGAKLVDIIRDAIEPFESSDARRFVVAGGSIEVSSGAVLPLSMVLNELCTNAVKYGALSNAEGRIHVTSAVDEMGQRLKLTWTEVAGPVVIEPARRSFGTRLIHALADQLHGDVRLIYEPEGVVCEFDLPLATLQVRRQE